MAERRRRSPGPWWSPRSWRRRLCRRYRRAAAAGHLWQAILGVIVVLACVLAVGLASAWRDLRPAWADITNAEIQLKRLDRPSSFATPEQRTTNRAAIVNAQVQLVAARRDIKESPALRLAQFVPFLRDQRSGLLDLVDDGLRGLATATTLLDQVQALPEQGRLRDATLPLDSLPPLREQIRSAGRVFETMPRGHAGLWGPVGTARRRLDELAATAAATLRQASDALDAMPGFFGAEDERRYLVAIENNAEMRDRGMVLSYGVLHFAGGRFDFERRGSIADLGLQGPTSTPVPAGTEEVFGSINPTTLWQSVNATADFEWSAGAMADMYRQATGQAIDGVIAIDVPGLAELLATVRPVAIAGVAEPVTARNAGRVLLHDLYENVGQGDSQTERRERLGEFAGAVIDRLTDGKEDVFGVAGALSAASTGGHLRLWSAKPAEEQIFVRTGLGGGPATKDPGRTFHLAVENRTGTKLDYYIKPRVRQEVRFSGKRDVVVRTTVEIDNQAPPDAAPSYQLGPDEFTSRPGDYTAWVLLWGPAGAVQAASTQESGLTLTQGVIPVAAGNQGAVVFDTLIHDAVRDGRLTLRLVPQPRLDPMGLSVTLDPRGRHVDGPTSWQGPWDRTRTFTWGVRP